MASLKVLLWDKKNKEGLYPIAIRIIKDRKPSYIYIGHYIDKSQWDEDNRKVKKSHPNSVRLNNLIAKKLSEANEKLLDLEVQKNDSSSRAIKKNITSKNNSSFFAQAAVHMENLKSSGKYNRVEADKPRIKHFKEFLEVSDITFQEITVPLLTKFCAYLKGTRKVKDRTVMNYLIMIRTIYNQAIAANLADPKHYPFGKGKIVIKFPDALKVGLTADEVKRIEDLDLEAGSLPDHSRNLWLFSFYFAGMRVSDILRLRWADFQNDRLFYSMGKNSKPGSLKVPEKALTILNRYKVFKTKDGLVFPDLNTVDDFENKFLVQRKTSYAVKSLNKYLDDVATAAEIDKKLTMHIARHTFGNISGDKIPIQMLQKLYRHSSVTTTIGYQSNFIHKDADEALDAVVSF